MTSKYKRKLLVFILCILVGIGAAFIMEDAKYKIFFENIVWIAIGFFISNAGEHFAKSIRKSDNNNVP